MTLFFLLAALAAVVAFLATPLVRRLSLRMGWVDLPNARKIHRDIIPRAGGIAVYLGFMVPLVGLWLVRPDHAVFAGHARQLALLVGGATAMLALGVYDDARETRAWQKAAVQLLIAVVVTAPGGLRAELLSNPLGGSLVLPEGVSWVVSAVWIVGVVNALNLLDGIDGLAAGVTISVAATLSVTSFLLGSWFTLLVCLLLVGAALGFLPFNAHPARIFLGDAGSLTLGFLLACISLLSSLKAATATVLVFPLIALGLPLYDTASSFVRRVARGQSPFKPDREHIHHRLLHLGLSQVRAVRLLYGVSALLGLLAIWSAVLQGGWVALPALLAAGLVLVLNRFSRVTPPDLPTPTDGPTDPAAPVQATAAPPVESPRPARAAARI